MIQPTIGRVVWVRGRVPGDQPETASICYVWGDRCINVGGFDKDGVPFRFTSLPLRQDGDPEPAPGPYAEWMPYQKGQAAKAEALEAQLEKK